MEMKPLKYNGMSLRFREAAHDFQYLLDHKYSQRSILKLIGDRYALTSTERSALYRGISSTEEARGRCSKLADPEFVNNNILNIDGYNVLITIGSYLNGNLVFISTDRLVRDASEIHGKAFRNEIFNKAILLIFSYLHTVHPAIVNFYFDKPVSHSGELCEKINILLNHYRIEGSATTLPSPDHYLKTLDEGLIATSDSSIVDRCKTKIIDLPRVVIEYHFKKELTNISEYLED
jgi:hypothetical protein